MTDVDRMLVAWIRARCARAFECERDTPFFCAHAEPGEDPDETILRVFRKVTAEPELSGLTDEEIVNVMIYG